MIRTYTELISIPTFAERYRYLKLGGKVGKETFGCDRWFNQSFYRSNEWRKFRSRIIIRDLGCDLACEGREFSEFDRVIIHHMNPIMVKDIVDHSDFLMNEEYLVAVTFNTHQAIHYGDESLLLLEEPTIRLPNDTCPWR